MSNIIVLAIFVLMLLAFVFFIFSQRKEKKRLLDSLDMVLFLIMMPKYERKAEAGNKEEKNLIGQMEQIFASFLFMKKRGFFENMLLGKQKIVFEIASQLGAGDISFFVAVPKLLETGFEKYVHGVYPKAIIQKVKEDYTIFEPGGYTAGAYLTLKENSYFPIATYKNLEKDPIAEITNTFSKISAEEGAAIQIVIRPMEDRGWRKKGLKIIGEMRQGKTFTESLQASLKPEREAFDMLFFGKTFKEDPSAREDRMKKVDDKAIQAIEAKIQKETFETNIRVLASAQTEDRAEQILNHLEGSFGQFGLFGFNSFKPTECKGGRLKKLVFDFSFRNFNINEKIILNIEELTSIYHFPTFFVETPYLKQVKSVEAPAPFELPELGKGLNTIGEVIFRGEKKEISYATRGDRRRHFYCIGQTGTGKSSLLTEMIRQDIENGEGVGVIDPHGELIEATLANIPEERIEDVVIFEPFDLERPVGLNMLEYDTPEQKDFAVQEMISIFHKLFPPEIIGPMFEHYMRNAMLALMADRDSPGTLVEIPRIFTDDTYMEERLKKVSDPLVKNFWLKEWKQTVGQTKSDMLGYVVSKVGRFVENDMMRNIMGQSHSGFDLAKIMDEKKIFLANLSKGLTGEVNSSLLGLILVSKMQMAAMKRARVHEEERKDFYLYVDEFQNFTTDSIVTILSEARKYRLNLILAHQYMPQLKEEIRNAVLGNVGTIACFRVGANDAEFLEKQFEPEFSKFDLLNLDNFTMIVKMMINNKISQPFKVHTFKPRAGNSKVIEPIKNLSKLKYGRPRNEVEKEITERARLGEL